MRLHHLHWHATFTTLSLVTLLVVVGASVSGDQCTHFPTLLESIPMGMQLHHDNSSRPSIKTSTAWLKMINAAEHSIDIGTYYMNLGEGAQYLEQGGQEGVDVLNALVSAVKRGVRLRVLLDGTAPEGYEDGDLLDRVGATVVWFPWGNVSTGGGVLHSKVMVVDGNSCAVGSANFDWKSLTQVKELGLVIDNCDPLVDDVQRIFNAYWMMGQQQKLIKSFPSSVIPKFNAKNPFVITRADGNTLEIYFAVSPAKYFSPPESTSEEDAILQAISTAPDQVHMSVMEYSPVSMFSPEKVYDAKLDDGLRSAALHGVSVNILCSEWEKTSSVMIPYLHSLQVLDNIDVRILVVPPSELSVPFTRVNHVKYVIANASYIISSSNFSPDYFENSLGISLVLKSADGEWNKMNDVFAADWSSQYTKEVQEVWPFPN